MITYISSKFNKINEKITQILKENKINIFDSEENIPKDVFKILQDYLVGILEPSSSFVSVACPKCGKKHLLPFASTYQRKIIFKVSNLLINLKIPVFRMKCSNCGSTHAVLPSFCVPFKQYSKQAILEIVVEAENSSTEAVANNLEIEAKQVRRMVNIVKKSKNNILQTAIVNPTIFKNKIDINSSISEMITNLPNNFDELYFKEFETVFLYIPQKRKIYIKLSKLSK